MPKKARKSIGQSTAKVRKFRQEDVTMANVNITVETDIALEVEPGPSGLQQAAIVARQDVDIEPEPEKEAARAFEAKLLLLNKMERKTARAFKERGIEEDFEWPSENEERPESLIRKHRNAAKLTAARLRQFRNPEDMELRQQRLQADAERKSKFRNPEDMELRQQRLQAEAERMSQFRNPEDMELRTQRLQAEAERMREFRNPEDQDLSEVRHEVHALQQQIYRIPGQVQRSRETPVQRQERVQRGLELRSDNRRANKKACKAFEILRGDIITMEQTVGSFKTCTGAYENLCEFCKAMRFPKERENICCQKGKVSLPQVPEPTPILKRLLEGQDIRSKAFRKYIIPMNNALAMASIKIQQKRQFFGNFQPQVIIQGRCYYYIAPLQVDEGQQPKFASLYVHDPSLEGC